jgi:hypothetical protein
LSGIAKLDPELIPAEYDGDALKWIAMPSGRFPRLEPLPSDKILSAMMQYQLVRWRIHGFPFRLCAAT